MAKSVTTYEKPTPHIGLPDWYAKQWELRQSADTRRSEAFELRSSSRIIRSETKIKTEWDTYMNNTRIADRLTELSRWRELLESQLERIENEIKLLKDERADTEKELEGLNLPLQITAECISTRDCRRGTELTYDDGDTELKKELCVLEGVKKLLTNRIQAAWEKLNRLEEVKFKIDLELQDKVESINIDQENLRLDRTCANISYKMDSLRIPKNSVSYESWLEHCQFTKLLADNEMSDTYSFREALHVTRERARNDIKAQQDVTDFALRKRIYQTQKARNELEWQKMKMQREMDILLKELARLDDALQSKTDAVKCAETRLENRTYRPGFELCRDEVDLGLKDEVLQLRQTKEDLIAKINSAKATYNGLEFLLIRIDKNLQDKQHSLMTDVMCLDLRARLKTGDRSRLANETDRNIVLTKMEQEVPPES
ncbi:tektin-2 [Cephus cinctus]|uniref:Tektin n=1 Tax=Cephus cinctus TaxID=211228 RepID=A0AAJ7FFG3_CEPCN|nr:tektin-2 [Cephus cinctus]XP_024937888.1 tektin-2 [Cephus cinctus]XP_024937889.1 tektin-2 [Cephus cinctus]XP_024937890.1 tektin-2 [Cephus cinctus]